MKYNTIKYILHSLPSGETEVRSGGKLRGLVKEVFNAGRSMKIYAAEIGGEDYISMNRYETEKDNHCKPCEMPLEKVADFLFGLKIVETVTLPTNPTNTLICGLGCFRGVQAAFDQQGGVIGTEVGYAGGIQIPHPGYGNVADYAEAIKVVFDPTLTSYQELIDFIFEYKDVTFKSSRSQYKYAVWYLDEEQKDIVENKIKQFQHTLEGGKVSLAALAHTHFERAEEYHQKYIEKTAVRGTCGNH